MCTSRAKGEREKIGWTLTVAANTKQQNSQKSDNVAEIYDFVLKIPWLLCFGRNVRINVMAVVLGEKRDG